MADQSLRKLKRRFKPLWMRKPHFVMPSAEAPMPYPAPLRCRDCREPMAWCSCVRNPEERE